MTKDSWSLKEYQPQGSAERWFFRKNLAPAVSVRHPDYRFVAFLTFAYYPKDETGLPSSEDEAIFFRIEDAELGELEENGLAVHVAAVTKSGIKDLLFYTRDYREFLKRAELYRSAYPQFQVSWEVSPDPAWSQYEDFP